MTQSHSFCFVSRLLVVFVCLSLPGAVLGASSKDPLAPINTQNGWGVKGYDPVAYFTIGEPTQGVDTHIFHWKGVAYRFASSDNQERFKAAPEKYLPQYGGYCSYAMSLNSIADIDPDRWAIVEEKLYLNNNRFSYGLWSVNKSGNIESADRNWAAWPKKIEGE